MQRGKKSEIHINVKVLYFGTHSHCLIHLLKNSENLALNLDSLFGSSFLEYIMLTSLRL